MTWCLKLGKRQAQIDSGEAETVSTAIQQARWILERFRKENRSILGPTRFRITVEDGNRKIADLGL